jgi:predicted NAD-dependent protein-ADP-ribosyltransferase YbiA (DUF1768 family)
LNRWFIFKRRSGLKVDAETTSVNNALAEATLAASATRGPISAARAVPEITSQAAAAVKLYTRDTGTAAKAVLEQMKNAATRSAAAAAAVAAAESPAADAVFLGEADNTKYKEKDIFRFYSNAAKKDVLKIGDPLAGRWLALTAPFPITDEEDGVKYPSIEHYMAGMRFKLASANPKWAWATFSEEGTIHQEFARERLVKLASEGVTAPEGSGVSKMLPESVDGKLIDDEITKVKTEIRPAALKKYKFDDAKWAAIKDKVLRTALEYRWTHDARFHTIVEAARKQKKVLLYYSLGTQDTGGKFNEQTGKIEGANKAGKLIMSLASFPGY